MSLHLQDHLLIFPASVQPAYSGWQVLQFIAAHLAPPLESDVQEPLVLIAFSAGVVGAIVAAHLWQQQGGFVQALIAIDGWGVPLWGAFPIHRFSHDHWTHWSSAWLGAGKDSFYADPAVPHLTLWQSPQTVAGWLLPDTGHPARRTTAAAAIANLLQQYSTVYGHTVG